MSHRKLSWTFMASLYFLAFIIIFGTTYLVNEARVRNSTGSLPGPSTMASERVQAGQSSQTAERTESPADEQEKSLSLERASSEAGKPAVLPGAPGTPKGEIIRPAGNYYSAALRGYIFHAGTDYAEAEGAVIRAIQAGTVVFAGPDPLLGEKVTLDLGNSWSINYGCLENIRVKEGEHVEVGTALGQVGYYPGPEGQGRPQLHYEIWHGDDVQVPSINTSFTN